MVNLFVMPVSLISMLIEKGFFYLLRFAISYVYLTFYRLIWKRRLNLYDYAALGQPEKNGFFVPQEEWELDPPRKYLALKEVADDAFVFGTNSKNEYLAVHISRMPDDNVRCSVVLQLANGTLYTLPAEHFTQKASSDEYTFGSSRLKLQCLVPMRKWRIFFNGILEECPNEGKAFSRSYKHVKFTFLWRASSDVFDFSSDMSKTALAHSTASLTSWISWPTVLLNTMLSIFNRYEQSGMFFGTVQVEKEPEIELYLWGTRGRSMGETAILRYSSYLDVYGNLKNGALMHVGILNVPGIIDRFIYGYVMHCDGHICPVDEVEYQVADSGAEKAIVKCCAGKENYIIKIDATDKTSINFPKELVGSSSIKTVKILMNEKEGKGFVLEGNHVQAKRWYTRKNTIPQSCSLPLPPEALLAIPFEHYQCDSSTLCGGKGSSLGKLFALANPLSGNLAHLKFVVPNGIVVTTIAYEQFTRNSLESILRKFETEVWSKSHKDIAELCQKIVQTVSLAKLPELVEKSIIESLKELYGDFLAEYKFAVRSSATGEDTEQMSAAGQMETFLGVKGIDEILAAVKKCWASQFTFQAVEYKRRYGQHLNTPMAVVVQEMIPCDVAGVMFTCDPVTGNPSYINITANWGLGESVVSASAEPDTIVLERDVFKNLTIHSTTVGQKRTKIVMNDGKGSQGTKQIELSDETSSVCCINDSEALQLGKIASAIEDEYGSPRDLEWGIAHGKICLFQCRPVTSIDVETDFEVQHCCDTALRCEMEVLTRAHIGELQPGALSVLGNDFLAKILDIAFTRQKCQFDEEAVAGKPYLPQRGAEIAFHQMFMNVITGIFKHSKENDDGTKSLVVSLFGRLIDDNEIRQLASERHPGAANGKLSAMNVLKIIFKVYVISYFSWVYIKICERRLKKFSIPYQSTDSSSEILRQIGSHYDIAMEALSVHMNSSGSSSLWNFTLLKMLAHSEGDWNIRVYSDFAYLVSTCNDVESADIPSSIQDLAYSISKSIDPTTFKTMDVEEAFKWLQTTTSEPGIKFKEFFRRHGDRCIKEFDVYSKVWSENRLSLVKTLQSVVSEKSTKPIERKIDSYFVVLSKLKIRLSFFEKIQLFWFLPNVRRAIREREYTKAFSCRMLNHVRKAFNHLAEQMVLEGRLPEKEHLFFLLIEEINQLCKTRSPSLVAKAARRWKCFEKVNKLMFPEITSGIPKPVNYYSDVPTVTGKGFCMTGVPVSQGVVKGTARVVKDITEASNIQHGDVLITYGTDIAWSPYFPLLSGIVTELGGLISHGAVVAREYGLPCVVSLHGAMRAFKSGDLVILDGNNGTLQRVDED